MCVMFVFQPKRVSNYTYSKCKLIGLLQEKVEGLVAQLTILRLIHENKEILIKAEVCIQNEHSKKEATSKKEEDTTKED